MPFTRTTQSLVRTMSKTISKEKTSRQEVGDRTLPPRFILLGLPANWRNAFPRELCVSCSTQSQISDVVRDANENSLWIAPRSAMIDQFIRAVTSLAVAHSGHKLRIGNLLMLSPPRAETSGILHGFFESVVGGSSSFKTLPREQLIEVLLAPKEQARDLFIGGLVDMKSRVLLLVRGDLSRLVVPLSIFGASGTTKPNFRRFEVDDYGHTIRFGYYEAGADFVLYALDPDFRRRSNAKRIELKRGFGPSLRRLRILRRLGRDSFGEISTKTIARIERGKVQRPREKTLRVICETLGVKAEEIETF